MFGYSNTLNAQARWADSKLILHRISNPASPAQMLLSVIQKKIPGKLREVGRGKGNGGKTLRRLGLSQPSSASHKPIGLRLSNRIRMPLSVGDWQFDVEKNSCLKQPKSGDFWAKHGEKPQMSCACNTMRKRTWPELNIIANYILQTLDARSKMGRYVSDVASLLLIFVCRQS